MDSKVSIAPPAVFYIEDEMYRYENGMTWDDWLNSEYNTIEAKKQNYYEILTTSNDSEGTYKYFDNNEYGIIIREESFSCGMFSKLYTYSYIIDNKNVTPEDEIKSGFHYTMSEMITC